jgi:hypothetical protein
MAALQKQFTYERHKPEETLLYKIVQENLLSFLEQVEVDTGYPLPDFVIKEFEEYLKCGILSLKAFIIFDAHSATSSSSAKKN